MHKLKTTLLYIIIILLIYVFLYKYIYNNKELKFDDYDQTTKQINNQSNETNKMNIKKSNFIDLKDEDGIVYNNKIDNVHRILMSMKTNDIAKLDKQIIDINIQKENNNSKILESLTDLYFKQYIEYINKQNAVVYNEYLRYNGLSSNK